MKKEFTIEQISDSKWLYRFTEPNKIGEIVSFELIENINFNSKNSMPNIWYKKGYTKKLLNTFWGIETFVKDTEGNCWGKYNPQEKRSEDGKVGIINFDWMLEATEENKQKLIDEVFRLSNVKKGMTATEIKIKNVYDFAKENGLEVVTEVPESWKKIPDSFTVPRGSMWISNGETFKSGLLQKKLLLLYKFVLLSFA